MLGLALTAPGFHYSVLSEYRDRVLRPAVASKSCWICCWCSRFSGIGPAAGARSAAYGFDAHPGRSASFESPGNGGRNHAFGPRSPGRDGARVAHAAGERRTGLTVTATALSSSACPKARASARFWPRRSGSGRRITCCRPSMLPSAPPDVRLLAAVQILWRVWLQQYYREA